MSKIQVFRGGTRDLGDRLAEPERDSDYQWSGGGRCTLNEKPQQRRQLDDPSLGGAPFGRISSPVCVSAGQWAELQSATQAAPIAGFSFGRLRRWTRYPILR